MSTKLDKILEHNILLMDLICIFEHIFKDLGIPKKKYSLSSQLEKFHAEKFNVSPHLSISPKINPMYLCSITS